jgi:hypothetical protein
MGIDSEETQSNGRANARRVAATAGGLMSYGVDFAAALSPAYYRGMVRPRDAMLMILTRRYLIGGKRFRRLAPSSHQSSADGNAAHGNSGSPAQGERAGEYDRGLWNGEQRDTEQDVLQPSYEEIMDQIYAIGVL